MTPDPGAGVVMRPAVAADGQSLAQIYNHYVLHSSVTFDEEPLSAEDMVARLDETSGASLPWLLAERQGQVLGYAYASKWKGRCSYRYSVEVTIYVRHGHERRGIGSALYQELLPTLQSLGIHVAIGTIALPNEASVLLHEKFGFRKAGAFQEVGRKFGRWVDVGYWQKIF